MVQVQLTVLIKQLRRDGHVALCTHAGAHAPTITATAVRKDAAYVAVDSSSPLDRHPS